jgi:hypothetical protein
MTKTLDIRQWAALSADLRATVAAIDFGTHRVSF